MASQRRTPGLSAFSRASLSSAQYATHGNALRASHASSLQAQLSVFQSLLHQFSLTHGKEIRSNPAFRAEFARMCNAIGVDPLLASNAAGAKGRLLGGAYGGGGAGSVWAAMLGGSVNDWYFELAVRVVEVCRATRAENGGLMAVEEVARRVQKGRRDVAVGAGALDAVSDDDVLRAVKSLEPLGEGFAVFKLGSKAMVRSVPRELNTDQTTVLEAVQVLGYVTLEMLQANLRWKRVRAVAVVDDLVAESLVWVDLQAAETEYWTPTGIHETGQG